MLAEIYRFTGEYFFLSNFYGTPTRYDGVVYPTSEHAFQAAKTIIPKKRREIRRAQGPGEAKRIGRRCTLRPNYEAIKIDLMREVLADKFRDPVLAQKLLDTGDAVLIEGNDWHDTFWGQVNHNGRNWLGRILMEIRTILQAGQLGR